DFHDRKLAQRSYASRDIHQHHAQMNHFRIPLHKVSAIAPSKSKPILPAAARTVVRAARVNAAKHSAVRAARVNAAKHSAVRAARVNAAKHSAVSAARVTAVKPSAVSAAQHNHGKKGNPQQALKDTGVIDSGCSRHMTGNMSYLSDFEELNGGYVTFGTGKGKIKTGKLDFDDVYYVKDLKFNLFSVSQMCDKKNHVLFTDTECLVLFSDFKLPDASQVLLRVPRENNMLGHVNFKTINKLVKGNLVRGLPSKFFTNDLTCVACKKGKQHRASCLENLLSLKVKIIRCDNRTEFKKADLNQFCGLKENQTNSNAGFQHLEKPGKEGTQTYVLFPVLSDGSTNPKNNKDAHTGG
nr:hypothetical protein [Tanacetum cinerariifolium]